MTAPRIYAATVGGPTAASSRIRVLDLLAHLRGRGWATRWHPASDRIWPLRALLVVLLWRPQIVVVQKLQPPRLFTALLRVFAHVLVYELDDAIYLGYPGSGSRGARAAARTFAIAGRADAIITSSARIKADLPAGCQDRVVVFPGPAPSTATTPSRARDVRQLVWLGSPSTYPDLRDLVLPALAHVDDVVLTVVGAPADTGEPGGVREVRWSAAAQARVLSTAHAGLAPLRRGEWNDRKAAYKVLEYLAAGVIPVCEDSPAIRALLGDRIHTLCVVVHPGGPLGWADAVRRARRTEVTDRWTAARDDVFEALSIDRYAQAFLDATGHGART